MNRILLLLEHKQNCRLLWEWLTTRYQVILPESDLEAQPTPLLELSFDLCILDARALDRHWQWVQAKRQAETMLLPFLAVTSRADVGMVTRHLWQSVDDLITRPIEKAELQARVEILLRSRQLSLELKTANEKLQTEVRSRQQIESALTESEAKFRALVQNSSDAITVVEPDGTIIYASPSSKSVLGFAPEELQGKNAFDFVHPDDLLSVFTPFRASLANPGETQVSEYRFGHKDGSWHYLESKSNFSPTKPSLNGIVVNSRDITERKQTEETLVYNLKKERELNEVRSRFFWMVSHDFRNPLNGILGATQILERYSEQWSQEKKQEFFERIKTSVKNMLELLEDVLLIGKSESKNLEIKSVPLDLEKLSQSLIEEMKLSTGNNHAIAFSCQGESANVCLDEKLLRYILLNLLSNAIKYSPQGSTIYFNLICQDGEVHFQIQDQGIGIPPQEQEQLFELFYRATNVKDIPGTGLGLAIVKRYVELQAGTITFTSKVGVGSTFTVSLPWHH